MTSVSSVITAMTKNDAIWPIIALEGAVVAGRTGQAYKRGGEDEARERFIEETTGSIVWLCGVQVLNKIGDKILNSLLKNDGGNFDVGTDKVLRTPFKNFMKNSKSGMSGTKVALLKATKVATSIAIANLFIGFAVPKINHALTHRIHEKKNKEQNQKQQLNIVSSSSSNEPSFKGAMAAVNAFTNAIENTNTGKLLSTDIGIAGGRMFNARNNEERREIGIRDIGSIYFYMWAQGHVRNLLNYVETGSFTRLNPSTSGILTKHLNEFIKSKGGELTAEEFRHHVLGKKPEEITLPEGIKFETGDLSWFSKFMNNFRKVKAEPLQVAKVEELEKLNIDSQIMGRIKEMSKLQPLREGQAVITKQQIIDAYNICEINNPQLLDKVFTEFTDGACKNEFRYVSNDKLYNLKSEMEKYIERICKKAKDGKITEKTLNKFKHKNTIASGVNFIAGFAVAALFLSTLIPKFQYWVTRIKTGKDEFPGTYDEK